MRADRIVDALPIDAQNFSFDGQQGRFAARLPIALQDGGSLHIAAFLQKAFLTRLGIIEVVAHHTGLFRPLTRQDAGVIDVGHRRHGGLDALKKSLLCCEAIDVWRGFLRQIVGGTPIDDKNQCPVHTVSPFTFVVYGKDIL